jgi:hypothetical protein
MSPPRILRTEKRRGAAVAISRTGKTNGRISPPLFFLACVLLLAVESNGEECYCDRQGHPARRHAH